MLDAAHRTAPIRSRGLPQRSSASRGVHGHLGQDRNLLVRPLGNDRAHECRIEDAGFCTTKRDLMPEAFSMNSAEEGGIASTRRGDGVGVFGVEPLDIGVEASTSSAFEMLSGGV